MSNPERMRAVRLHGLASDGRPPDLRLDDVETPRPGPDEVLVEVAACGLGDSDLRVIDGTTSHGPTLPRILGHEAAGHVAAVGVEVTDWQPGDPVAVATVRPCRHCGYCRAGRENLCQRRTVAGATVDGALARFLVADPGSLVPVPVGVALDQAALVTETVAIPYHAMKRAGVGDGTSVAVVGLDALGLHAVQLAKLAGAEVVGIDTDQHRRERALDWGADEVVDPSDGDIAVVVRERTNGGVDRSLVFLGPLEAADQAVRVLAPGGRAVVVGPHRERLTTVPVAEFVEHELEIVGSSRATPQDVGELFDLLDDGRLDLTRSVSDTTDLDGVIEALERLRSGTSIAVRTVVTDLT